MTGARVGADGGDVGGGGAGEGVLVGAVCNLGVDVGLGGGGAHGVDTGLSRVDEGFHGGEDVVGAAGGAEEALGTSCAGGAISGPEVGVGDERLGGKQCGPLGGFTIYN